MRTARIVAGALLLSGLAVGGGVLAWRFSTAGGPTAPATIGSPAAPGPTASAPSAAPSAVRARACERPTRIGTVAVDTVAAMKRPDRSSPVVATFGRTNPQGAPTVFDLEEAVDGADGRSWFRAVLPIRPNGTSGFIPAAALEVADVSYRIVVDRTNLRLVLRQGCDVVKEFQIGLGKESTPTPDGRFYIVSLLKPPNADSVYGTYAYGLSAYSDAITDWKGGGIIGIHGTNEPSSIGDRKSHGCIRMRNEDIEQLVPLLPLGTPVVITGAA